jgi:hypothetical protein
MFCLELWYFVEKYSNVLDAVIQLSAYGTVYFQTELWNFSSTGDSYFQIRNTVLCFGNLNVIFGSLSNFRYSAFTVSRGKRRKLLGTITHMDDLLANEPGSNPIILEVYGYARIFSSKKWKADYCPQWGYTYIYVRGMDAGIIFARGNRLEGRYYSHLLKIC